MVFAFATDDFQDCSVCMRRDAAAFNAFLAISNGEKGEETEKIQRSPLISPIPLPSPFSYECMHFTMQYNLYKWRQGIGRVWCKEILTT